MGGAMRALSEKLSVKQFMREATGSFAPALFLLSDGAPTDDFDAGLEALRKNSWYRHAIKVAVAIGNDANKDVLGKFTGGAESVLETHSAASLKKMVKFVSVRASSIASQSSMVKEEPIQKIETTNSVSADATASVVETPSTVTSSKQENINTELAEAAAEINDEDEEW
jgi:uncharacterized protein YegL